MSPFPEEQLDSQVGYIALEPGQTIEGGKWRIVRKAGWGPRSSSWLAVYTEALDEYSVLKIFTTAATRESSVTTELKLLRGPLNIRKVGYFACITDLENHFYEESPKGRHLCMVLHPLGTSIEALRLSNPESPGTLPMHIVQQVVCQLVGPLRILENRKVIHGAVTPDNFLFASVNAASDIERAIETAPPPIPVESVTGDDGMVYPVVKSQSIGEEYSWNLSQEYFAEVTINLNNFGHASLAGGNIFLDAPLHLLPPEAVGGRPQLTTQTNIWQLGCTAYLLVTGKPLLSDSYVKSPEENLSQTLDKLEELLASSNKLSEQDIILMAQFLRSCLAVEPADRPTAGGLREYAWVKAGSMCSCGWHEGDNLLPKSSFV